MKFETVLKSIIKKSGGSIDKIDIVQYMEKFNHSLAFAPLNYWLGITIMKNPLDLAVLQQIIFDKKPDTIIECGTAYGGSAYFMACMMDLMRIQGKIFTIDCEPNQSNPYIKKELIKIGNKTARLTIEESHSPAHPKITTIISDCLKAKIPTTGKKTMVILDCHHSQSHVSQELEKYAHFVSIGQYLIVEDTDAQGLQGGGPSVAVKKFLTKNSNFVVDKNREKYGISSNLGGYLVRIS